VILAIIHNETLGQHPPCFGSGAVIAGIRIIYRLSLWISPPLGWHDPTIICRNDSTLIHDKRGSRGFVCCSIDLAYQPSPEGDDLREAEISSQIGGGGLEYRTVPETEGHRLIEDPHFSRIPETVLIGIKKYTSLPGAEPAPYSHITQIHRLTRSQRDDAIIQEVIEGEICGRELPSSRGDVIDDESAVRITELY
jgi:hypothetical protein